MGSVLLSIIILFIGVYGSFIAGDKYHDVFLIWSIISLVLNSFFLLLSPFYKKEDLEKTYNNPKYYFSITSSVIWCFIWGNLVINGLFWTGFMGITSCVFGMILSTVLIGKIEGKIK